MSWEFQNIECIVKQGKGNLVSGPFGSNISRKYFVDEGVPVIRGNNLPKDFTKFFDGGFVFITEEKAFELKNCLTIADDIIFTSAGTVGDVGLIPHKTNFEKYIISNKQIRLRVDTEKVNPLFIYYWLKQSNIKQEIVNLNTGSSIPLLTLGSVKKISISYPKSLETQNRIASILSNYDDLIENNHKRIKLLEETAQNIYKEWFVNFRFPNYEHMEFDLESGLPVGWFTKKVTDFFDFIKGIEVGSANYENTPNSEVVPFLRVGDISKRDGGIYVKKSLVKDKFVEKNDILISFDGSIGSVGYGLEGSYSSGLRKITTKTEIFGTGFMYCLVKSDEIQNTINAHAKGTTILHAGTSIIHLEFQLATYDVILRFNQILNPIFEQMVSLNNQNQKLKEARDILLPRLMNRTIEV